MDYGKEESNYSQQALTGQGGLMKDVSPKLRSRIASQVKALEAQLEGLRELEKLLDENPAIEKFQDVLARVRI